MVSPKWQSLIDEKRALRQSLIRKTGKFQSMWPASFANFIAFKLLGECGILTNEEFDITENYDATALLGLLASKKVSSITVTTAFCKRAAIGQQLVSEPFLLPMNVGN